MAAALTLAGGRCFNTTTDREQSAVPFAEEFLQALLVESILRYLAEARFGRSRGNFTEESAGVLAGHG